MFTGKVRANSRIAQDHFLLSLETGEAFRSSSPGQFVMLKIKGVESPFLARPMSIYSLKAAKDKIRIEVLYQVVGRGTALLSGLKKGDRVGLLGPLGKGFTLFPESRKIVMIAGGIGIAPLSFLADAYRRLRDGRKREIVSYVGARSDTCLVGMNRLQRVSQVKVSSDDGSCGYRGSVTDLLEKDLEMVRDEDPVVYACGPLPMFKRLDELLRARKWTCQVSLEARMACGVGACLGCVVRMKEGEYRRVCVDGPVFNLYEIAYE